MPQDVPQVEQVGGPAAPGAAASASAVQPAATVDAHIPSAGPVAKTYYSQLVELATQAGFVASYIPTMIGSAAGYFVHGPPVRTWPLNFHLVWTFVRTWMSSQNNAGNIEKAQRSMMKPGVLPKTGRFEIVEVPRAKAAVDFMLAHSSAAPPEASEIGTTFTAEWVWHESSLDEGFVVYMLHGGGYFLGSAQFSRPIAYKLAKLGRAKTFGINYRLAPPSAFPCAVIDAISGYLYLLDKGIDPSRIVFDGESAGGGLAASTLLAIRDMGLPLPTGAVLMSPWVDLSHSFPSFELNGNTDYLPARMKHPALGDNVHFYAPNSELKNQFVSPFWASTLEGLPSMLVQVGSAERLFDEGVAFGAKVADAFPREQTDGKQRFVRIEIYEGQVHVFQIFNFLDAARCAFNRAGQFILQVTGREPMVETSSKVVIDHTGQIVETTGLKAKL